MNPLKVFYDDRHMRDAVKLFQIDQLERMALTDVFEGKDTSGYREARELVDKVFDKLDEMFEEKKPIIKDSPR